LGFASSIAAADWDACGILYTIKTAYGKTNRGNSGGRERCIAVTSQVARCFTETETYSQKANG
jgi:hypothetical protein